MAKRDERRKAVLTLLETQDSAKAHELAKAAGIQVLQILYGITGELRDEGIVGYNDDTSSYYLVSKQKKK